MVCTTTSSLIAGNIAPIFGIIILLIFLSENKILEKSVKKIFFQLIVLEIIEVFAYNAELYMASLPEPTMLRVLFSAIGYTVRPMFIFQLLRIHMRQISDKKYIHILMIPVIICAIVSFSALFNPAVFYYDASNVFHRGLLGYCPHLVSGIYLVVLLGCIIHDQNENNRLESIVILITALYITTTITIEAVMSIPTIGRTSIVFGTIFYYMFFQTQHFYSSVEEIKNLSKKKQQIDGLTQILNKEGFFERAQSVLNQTIDVHRALLFFDIDNFKMINDQLGHLQGDQVLKDIAQKTKQIFRKDDVIGRFGGDEFYVLLSNISQQTLINRLEDMLERLELEYGEGDVHVTVTVSIGVAFFNGTKPVDFEEILHVADRALYEVKNTGRHSYIIKELP